MHDRYTLDDIDPEDGDDCSGGVVARVRFVRWTERNEFEGLARGAGVHYNEFCRDQRIQELADARAEERQRER